MMWIYYCLAGFVAVSLTLRVYACLVLGRPFIEWKIRDEDADDYRRFRAALIKQGYLRPTAQDLAWQNRGDEAHRDGAGSALSRPKVPAPPPTPTVREDPEVQGQRAHRIVEQVRQQLGDHRLDLDFILDAPGLFDINFAPAQEFWEAMTSWEDHGRTLQGQQALTQAEHLQNLFEEAVAAARASGLDHMSSADRTDVRTAQKLVAKAASTTSTPERDALMARAAKILAELNLAFLNRDTITSITRLHRHAIQPLKGTT